MTVHPLPRPAGPSRVLLVTGMSGAGKSTALKALEDAGYETVDNMPLGLLKRLLGVKENPEHSPAGRPLAIGIDARTRAFDAEGIVGRLQSLRDDSGIDARLLFLDCAGGELTRRFSETRRRHPLALDRPAADGIAREREMLAPLRRWADAVIDTTDYSTNDLRRAVAEKFADDHQGQLTLTVMSFGYARGLPRDADLVFDMRFLRNPHWDATLRPLTGLDAQVGAFVSADSGYLPAFERIADLLALLIPRYAQEGKAYLTIAFGCTGGRHRSVHVTEAMAGWLRDAGHEPTVVHRDLRQRDDGTSNDTAELELGRRGESRQA